jgi:hypothetical protein
MILDSKFVYVGVVFRIISKKKLPNCSVAFLAVGVGFEPTRGS